MGVVHQENVGLGVFGKIALRDVLAVAAVIGERQRVVVQNLDEAFWPAAMLDIGLSVCGGGCQKHAVLSRQKRGELIVDFGAPAAVLLDAGIGAARSLACLNSLDGRGERQDAGKSVNVWHRGIPWKPRRRNARARGLK